MRPARPAHGGALAAPAHARQPGRPTGPTARGARDGARRGRSRARDAWPLTRVEEEHIRLVLARHRGNATAAARQLGISRTTLWRKLRQYGIPRTSG